MMLAIISSFLLFIFIFKLNVLFEKLIFYGGNKENVGIICAVAKLLKYARLSLGDGDMMV